MSTGYYYRVPRSFKLRMELESAEKGIKGGDSSDNDRAFISYGLGDVSNTGFDKPSTYNTQLSDWNCTIIGPQNTNIGDRIYTIKIKCGAGYPARAPTVVFVTRINMGGVDSQGRVTLKTIGCNWNGNCKDMYSILKAIRSSMRQAAKLTQPQRDTSY